MATVRELVITPAQRAQARDSYVREFDRQFRDWVGIASCCVEVQNDLDYRILGFSSFEQWLEDAAPASLRYLKLVMAIYKGLVPDIPEETLRQIPLGTSAILHRQVKSPKLRRDPKVLEAAKQKPKKFTAAMQAIAPQQHVEGVIRQPIDFTASQWAVVENAWETYELLMGEPMGLAQFVEFLVTEWLDSEYEDSGYSNREKAQQMHAAVQ